MISLICIPEPNTKITFKVFDYYQGYQDQKGRWHQDNGFPAVEHVSGPSKGSKMWFINGKRHRIGGPASIEVESSHWQRNSHYHRLNAPAVVYKCGNKSYYEFGYFLFEIVK
jgi:hypothetical protein